MVPGLTNKEVPIEVQAWDRNAYAFNNPLKYNDPDGHDPKGPDYCYDPTDPACGAGSPLLWAVAVLASSDNPKARQIATAIRMGHLKVNMDGIPERLKGDKDPAGVYDSNTLYIDPEKIGGNQYKLLAVLAHEGYHYLCSPTGRRPDSLLEEYEAYYFENEIMTSVGTPLDMQFYGDPREITDEGLDDFFRQYGEKGKFWELYQKLPYRIPPIQYDAHREIINKQK